MLLASTAVHAQPVESKLDVRCVGSEVSATLAPEPARRVTRVEFFIGPSGADTVDKTAPFEAHFSQDVQQGPRQVVEAVVYGSGEPERVSSRSIARCPKKVAGRPPLVARIVEGRSMAGVEIGMTFGEVEEEWGSPKPSACHGTSESEPPGSPGYELGGLQCDWDIEYTVRGISEGLISAFYAPSGFTDQSDLRVRSLFIFRDKRLAKYRRWRTTTGIGLGSPLKTLKRAYGGRLRHVPPRDAVRVPPAERYYYVVTPRNEGRWVTFFAVPTGKEPNSQARAWEVDHVRDIHIMSSASFRQYVLLYARRGWRP